MARYQLHGFDFNFADVVMVRPIEITPGRRKMFGIEVVLKNHTPPHNRQVVWWDMSSTVDGVRQSEKQQRDPVYEEIDALVKAWRAENDGPVGSL